MRSALEAYGKLPRSERLLPRPPNPRRDRMVWPDQDWKRPTDILDLQVVDRGLPFDDMEPFDIRHPDYYEIDRLWLTPGEFQAFLPAQLSRGARTRVTGAAVDRLVYHSHLIVGSMVWREDEILRQELDSEVASIQGSNVTLRFSGAFEFDAHNEWNGTRYRGSLLGEAVYDTRAGRFTAFEMLARGQHTLDEFRIDMHRGSTHTTTVGMLVTLNGESRQDRFFPGDYLYGYPEEWKR
jgi:hypothetical protein